MGSLLPAVACHSSMALFVSSPSSSSFGIPSPLSSLSTRRHRRSLGIRWRSSDKLQTPTTTDAELPPSGDNIEESVNQSLGTDASASTAASSIQKDLKKVVNKTAATFAPRASTASKNPAVPGTTLYSVFEIQGYVCMFLGGVLSFNLVFPSNEPDLWRLMGMWSIWMFTIPSLRARDCSSKEKEALNYLFLLVPLLNVIIPFFWKSFAVVWSADTVAFFAMYAWKLGWLEKSE